MQRCDLEAVAFMSGRTRFTGATCAWATRIRPRRPVVALSELVSRGEPCPLERRSHRLGAVPLTLLVALFDVPSMPGLQIRGLKRARMSACNHCALNHGCPKGLGSLEGLHACLRVQDAESADWGETGATSCPAVFQNQVMAKECTEDAHP